jgi:hypothetical protein
VSAASLLMGQVSTPSHGPCNRLGWAIAWCRTSGMGEKKRERRGKEENYGGGMLAWNGSWIPFECLLIRRVDGRR